MRGLVSSQELMPFLNRIAAEEGTLKKGTFTGRLTLAEKLLAAKPQGIELEEFQDLVRDRVAGTSVAALEHTRARRSKRTSLSKSDSGSSAKDGADVAASEASEVELRHGPVSV